MSELRWNPLLDEWVITATHRQERTFLPPKDYCPLCPTRDDRFPTEVPAGDFEIVTFENRFPSLQRHPPEPAVVDSLLYRTRPAAGVCEVVLFTPDHEATLADLGVTHLDQLIQVWTDRYQELGSLDYVDYVYIFENKGEVIGVTLRHPHGQIYAFPYIPPLVRRELDACAKHTARTGQCLLCDVLSEELADGRRVVWQNDTFVAVVPFYARWPYEIHLLPRAHLLSLSDFTATNRRDLAWILKVILRKYDGLFGFSFPYVMAMHQRPTDGGDHSTYHFHIEFYPPYRSRDRLKYLAGCESGAGTFINDTLAEEKAAELRKAPPREGEEVR